MSPRDDRSGCTEDAPVITSPPLNPPASCDNETSGRKRTISNSQLAPILPEVPHLNKSIIL